MKIAGHIGAGFAGRLSGRVAGRFAELRTRVGRARYFRGHGVHSPFVYELVRQVFMRRELLPGDRQLFRMLIAAGAARMRAVQLQNLAIHCRYATFGLNRADGDLCVATCALRPEELLALVREAAGRGCTVAVLAPYADRERLGMCRRIVAVHPSTTVDNRAYLLIFNNYLPKQHFVI